MAIENVAIAVQNSYKKLGPLARVLSPTLAYRNNKNNIKNETEED